MAVCSRMHSAALAVNFTDCMQHGLSPPPGSVLCPTSSHPIRLWQLVNDVMVFGVVCVSFVLLWVGLGMRVELPALLAPGRSRSSSALAAFPRGDCSPAPQGRDLMSGAPLRHDLVWDRSVDVELLWARAGPLPGRRSPPHGRGRCN